MSTNTGVKPQCSAEAMSETQVIGRHDDLARAVQVLEGGEGDQVGGGAGVHEHAMADAEPVGPLGLESADLEPLGENRVILANEIANRVEIVARNIVFHQRPVKPGQQSIHGMVP